MQDNLFDNTEIAFKDKSVFALYRGYIIFKIISFPRIVSFAKFILSFKLIYPLTKLLLKNTMLKQFCGGQNEDDCKNLIQDLNSRNVYSILDYSVEGLENELSFEETVSRTLNLIELNTSNNFPFIVFKPTGIGRFDLYKKKSSKAKLSDLEKTEYASISACEKGQQWMTATALLREMQQWHMKANAITYMIEMLVFKNAFGESNGCTDG